MAPLRCKLLLLALASYGCDSASAGSNAGSDPQAAVPIRDGGLAGSTAYAPVTGGAASALDAGSRPVPPPRPSEGGAGDEIPEPTEPESDAATAAPPDAEQLVSALSGAQVYALCEEVDRRLGLIGDIAAACRVEAWLSSMSEEGCEAVLSDCSETGESGLGLEQGSPCAEQALPDCNATVAATLACADDNGAFFRTRSCDAENLRERVPVCSDALAELCPPLFERH